MDTTKDTNERRMDLSAAHGDQGSPHGLWSPKESRLLVCHAHRTTTGLASIPFRVTRKLLPPVQRVGAPNPRARFWLLSMTRQGLNPHRHTTYPTRHSLEGGKLRIPAWLSASPSVAKARERRIPWERPLAPTYLLPAGVESRIAAARTAPNSAVRSLNVVTMVWGLP
jgi:hypothetical protein